jgi:alpha-glucosidase
MDMVMNHTSHQHPWFLESRSSRLNPRRDWYIWRDGKGKRPPNNWMSGFGGPAWSFDEETGQYYLHSFLAEQPDVNWRNPDLREAMWGEIRFWLDRGVDGFRLDVVNWFMKDEHFRDNPFSWRPHFLLKRRYDRNRPDSHMIFRELRCLLDEYKGKMAVGEVFSMPPGDPGLSARYLGSGDDELHLAFDFSLLYASWDARRFHLTLKRWMNHIPEKGWPCHVLSNHDQPRAMSRFGGGTDGDRRARVAAVLLLTLRGTPFIYYGEEIGMSDISVSRKDLRDPLGIRFWPFFTGRDRSRSPMQWHGGCHGGFSDCTPWLPLNPDYRLTNVESELDDTYSMLRLYRRLIRLRRRKEALRLGSWKPAIRGLRGVMGYYRIHGESVIFVILNFTGENRHVHVPHRGQWQVLFSTHRFIRHHITDLELRLSPFEATVLEKNGCF